MSAKAPSGPRSKSQSKARGPRTGERSPGPNDGRSLNALDRLADFLDRYKIIGVALGTLFTGAVWLYTQHQTARKQAIDSAAGTYAGMKRDAKDKINNAIAKIDDPAVVSDVREQAFRDLKTVNLSYADTLDIEGALQATVAYLRRRAALPAGFTGSCSLASSPVASELQDALNAFGHVRHASVDTDTVRLTRLDLRRATLSQMTLRSVAFDSACLNGLTISDAHLSNVSFKGGNLSSALIQGLSGDTVDFAHSKLIRAVFSGDTLRTSVFRDAHLECSRLINVQLVGTDFTDSYLDWADMSQADLQGVMGWDRVRSFKNAFVGDIVDHNQHLVEMARRDLAEADPTKHAEWARRRDSVISAGQICR